MLGTQVKTKCFLLCHTHQTQTHLIPEYPKLALLNVERIQEMETRSGRHLREMNAINIVKIVQPN